MASITFDATITPFKDTDEEGFTQIMNRITVDVFADGTKIWSKTIITDDAIESVFGEQERLYNEALRFAIHSHGYTPTGTDLELAGYIM